MAIPPPGVSDEAVTRVARTVLLDALAALRDHRRAVVLVGAQAVYLRAGTADLSVAMYTTDGDVGIDPARLGPDPRLEAAMAEGGFTRDHTTRQRQPGTWYRTELIDGRAYEIAVDLLASGGAHGRSSRRRSSTT